jgi:hypothetical protein
MLCICILTPAPITALSIAEGGWNPKPAHRPLEEFWIKNKRKINKTKELRMRIENIFLITMGLVCSCATFQEKQPAKTEQNLDDLEAKGYEVRIIEAQEKSMVVKYYPYKFAQNMISKEKTFKQNGDLAYAPKAEDLEKIKGGMIRISKDKFNQSNKYTMEILDNGNSIGECFDGENIYAGKGHPKGFYMSNSGRLGYSFGSQPGETQVDCGLGAQKPDIIDVILKKNGKNINKYSVIFNSRKEHKSGANQ